MIYSMLYISTKGNLRGFWGKIWGVFRTITCMIWLNTLYTYSGPFMSSCRCICFSCVLLHSCNLHACYSHVCHLQAFNCMHVICMRVTCIRVICMPVSCMHVNCMSINCMHVICMDVICMCVMHCMRDSYSVYLRTYCCLLLSGLFAIGDPSVAPNPNYRLLEA